MRTPRQRDQVAQLLSVGLNDCAIARITGIPRETIREWRRPRYVKKSASTPYACPRCERAALAEEAYAYLLGLYLGDGCLSLGRRDVYRLRISLDARYPRIIEECAWAIEMVSQGRRVGRHAARGCVVVYACWKHWPCVFPQHGPGPKHKRPIELLAWQREIARMHPAKLLRGLIQSDGSRFLNRVAGRAYVRYQFTNNSRDIRAIFCRACEDCGVSWSQPFWKTISVARASDIAKLDALVGPKR